MARRAQTGPKRRVLVVVQKEASSALYTTPVNEIKLEPDHGRQLRLILCSKTDRPPFKHRDGKPRTEHASDQRLLGLYDDGNCRSSFTIPITAGDKDANTIGLQAPRAHLARKQANEQPQKAQVKRESLDELTDNTDDPFYRAAVFARLQKQLSSLLETVKSVRAENQKAFRQIAQPEKRDRRLCCANCAPCLLPAQCISSVDLVDAVSPVSPAPLAVPVGVAAPASPTVSVSHDPFCLCAPDDPSSQSLFATESRVPSDALPRTAPQPLREPEPAETDTEERTGAARREGRGSRKRRLPGEGNPEQVRRSSRTVVLNALGETRRLQDGQEGQREKTRKQGTENHTDQRLTPELAGCENNKRKRKQKGQGKARIAVQNRKRTRSSCDSADTDGELLQGETSMDETLQGGNKAGGSAERARKPRKQYRKTAPPFDKETIVEAVRHLSHVDPEELLVREQEEGLAQSHPPSTVDLYTIDLSTTYQSTADPGTTTPGYANSGGPNPSFSPGATAEDQLEDQAAAKRAKRRIRRNPMLRGLSSDGKGCGVQCRELLKHDVINVRKLEQCPVLCTQHTSPLNKVNVPSELVRWACSRQLFACFPSAPTEAERSHVSADVEMFYLYRTRDFKNVYRSVEENDRICVSTTGRIFYAVIRVAPLDRTQSDFVFSNCAVFVKNSCPLESAYRMSVELHQANYFLRPCTPDPVCEDTLFEMLLFVQIRLLYKRRSQRILFTVRNPEPPHTHSLLTCSKRFGTANETAFLGSDENRVFIPCDNSKKKRNCFVNGKSKRAKYMVPPLFAENPESPLTGFSTHESDALF